MRNYKRYMLAVLMCSTMIFSACDKENDVNSSQTTGNVLNNSTENVNEATSEENVSDEETTEDNVQEVKQIDGFYNCTGSEQPYVRIDFEIKTDEERYLAIFYEQYTYVDSYAEGQILYGEKTGENTYEFNGVEESYTVTWDGADKLRVDGTLFSGDFERGVKDGYSEDEYMIPDIPSYEADKNVEAGIEIYSGLAKAVRNELGYSEDETLTYSDLESVTYLAAWEGEFVSIKGISLLKNLEELHIGSGYITDISELGELEHIRCIDIASNYIEDISALAKCSNLSSIYLGGNKITDVSPVADMKSLTFADLNNNFITSIEPLKNTTSLEMLCIENNCILDYASVKDCETLVNAFNNGAQCSFEEALELENRAKEIVASFPSELSELELEEVIYKYIIENMYFSEAERPMSAFGYCGIMNGWGVCGDYAQAFALLANHAGLEAYTCGSDNHEWNIVKIDGVYYHCDALWDEGIIEWCHFNKSTSYIYNLPDHMHDLRRYPICDISMSVLEYCDAFGVE